jgi:2-polyprenyl-6-methoxyphenol hydroxylase-like FAD-dependent oxidoreductase
MGRDRYDIVTVGGGLGGAALAKAMAEQGARVLVLERTRGFHDRVRGEVLVPWGCAEARKLGLFDLLRQRCGHELRWWDADIDGTRILHRDVVATTAFGLPVMTYFHPDMQNLVLHAALAAGAQVHRGVTVVDVQTGSKPRVSFEQSGCAAAVEARLVVGADGRGSSVRKWGGFAVERDPQRRFFAGVLLEDLSAPEDVLHSRFAPREGLMSWLFPQGGGRVRAYIGYHAASDYRRLSGRRDMPRFVETSVRLGVPKDCFAEAKVAGPLATFDGTDNWVEHPYKDGVALIGDAAATSDPTWGQGMSQTLRDARVLSETLLADDDWDAAAHAFADEHDRSQAACHAADTWYTDLFLEIGPEAEKRRARALPRIAADLTRLPDTPLSGPEVRLDENARRRFFGEDA